MNLVIFIKNTRDLPGNQVSNLYFIFINGRKNGKHPLQRLHLASDGGSENYYKLPY